MKSLKERTKLVLELWADQENGEGRYRFAGPYWEVLYPIFKKYSPVELKQYENLLGEEFQIFNEEVFKAVDSGDEEENWRNGIEYFNARLICTRAGETHEVDLLSGETISYMPNRFTEDFRDIFD